MTTLYIAGPMTGLPDYNRPAFNKAQAQLEAAGYRVLNPARQPDGLSYTEYMDRGYDDIRQSDGVALLDGWDESPGANAEVRFADRIAVDASPVGSWLMQSIFTKDTPYPSLSLP